MEIFRAWPLSARQDQTGNARVLVVDSAKGKLGSLTPKEAGSWDVGGDGGKGDVCFKKIPNLVFFLNSALLWEVKGLSRKNMWLGSTWLDSCCWWQVSNIFPRLSLLLESQRLPWCLSGKETACLCRRHGFDPWVGKIRWRRE